MTENEIIKALGCCLSSNDLIACWKCPAVKFDICCDGSSKISNGVINKVIDLITRQKAEIEALKSDVDFLDKHNDELIARVDKLMPYGTQVEVSKKIEKEIKSEAIKEFAKRAKEKASRGFWNELAFVDVDDIDNLVNEMMEEGK